MGYDGEQRVTRTATPLTPVSRATGAFLSFNL